MVRHGQYRLETYEESGEVLIRSTLYIEGDVLTEVNGDDNSIHADSQPEKIEQHMLILNRKVSSLRIMGRHLQLLITGAMTLPTWLLSWDQLWHQLAFLGGSLVVGFFTSKIISRYLLRIVNRLAGPVLKLLK